MKKIGLGMIGAGRATELHMNGLRRYSGAHVKFKTISARRQEQVMEAKKRYGFEKATLDYHDILNDPEIDVVDICTPPYVHKEEIIQAYEAALEANDKDVVKRMEWEFSTIGVYKKELKDYVAKRKAGRETTPDAPV